MSERLTNKQKKIIYIISILIVIVLMLFLSLVVAKPFVENLRNPQEFKKWIDSFGIFSRIVFILMVIIQVVIAFIPGEPFEIAAGYCFGWFEGLLLSLIGITIASGIIYVMVKKYSHSFIEIFFKNKEMKKLDFLKDPLRQKNLIFIVNLLPGTPKDALSYFIGLTDIGIKSWAIIVFFARIPSVITSTITGHYLAKQQYGKTVIVFVITVALSLIGLCVYNYLQKRHSRRTSNENNA